MFTKRLVTVFAALVVATGSGVAQADPPSTLAWSPPANLVQPLNEVWRHVETTYPNLYAGGKRRRLGTLALHQCSGAGRRLGGA